MSLGYTNNVVKHGRVDVRIRIKEKFMSEIMLGKKITLMWLGLNSRRERERGGVYVRDHNEGSKEQKVEKN